MLEIFENKLAEYKRELRERKELNRIQVDEEKQRILNEEERSRIEEQERSREFAMKVAQMKKEYKENKLDLIMERINSDLLINKADHIHSKYYGMGLFWRPWEVHLSESMGDYSGYYNRISFIWEDGRFNKYAIGKNEYKFDKNDPKCIDEFFEKIKEAFNKGGDSFEYDSPTRVYPDYDDNAGHIS